MPPKLPPAAISVPAEYAQVRMLADWLRQRCSEAGLGNGATVDLELALVEAANNVIEHGGTSDEIGVEFVVAGGVAVLTLRDTGRMVPKGLYRECRELPLDAEGGRGIGILRSCIDAIQYATEEGVNRLTLTKLVL